MRALLYEIRASSGSAATSSRVGNFGVFAMRHTSKSVPRWTAPCPPTTTPAQVRAAMMRSYVPPASSSRQGAIPERSLLLRFSFFLTDESCNPTLVVRLHARPTPPAVSALHYSHIAMRRRVSTECPSTCNNLSSSRRCSTADPTEATDGNSPKGKGHGHSPT